MTIDQHATATAGGSTGIPRDRWGRPLVTPPGGGKPIPYTRCTTFAGAIEDTWNLTKWKQRQTAAGIASRRDLHLRAASLGTQPDDPDQASTWKRQMDDVCEQAMEAVGSSASATIGTALHSFAELVDRGLNVAPPAEYAGHIAAYQRATAGFEPTHVEEFVVHDGYRIGGTADRIYREKASGRLVIGDIKTGTIDYPHKIAMQLATYANSVRYDQTTGKRTPLGDIDRDVALIIHLDAKTGACELHWVDIQLGWEAVALAAKVRAWRDRRGLTFPAATPEQAEATVQAVLVDGQPGLDVAIGQATTLDQLIGLRQTHAAAWTDHHTALLAGRVTQITAGV